MSASLSRKAPASTVAAAGDPPRGAVAAYLGRVDGGHAEDDVPFLGSLQSFFAIAAIRPLGPTAQPSPVGVKATAL